MKTNPHGWLGVPGASLKPAGGRARVGSGSARTGFSEHARDAFPGLSPALGGPGELIWAILPDFWAQSRGNADFWAKNPRKAGFLGQKRCGMALRAGYACSR